MISDCARVVSHRIVNEVAKYIGKQSVSTHNGSEESGGAMK